MIRHIHTVEPASCMTVVETVVAEGTAAVVRTAVAAADAVAGMRWASERTEDTLCTASAEALVHEPAGSAAGPLDSTRAAAVRHTVAVARNTAAKAALRPSLAEAPVRGRSDPAATPAASAAVALGKLRTNRRKAAYGSRLVARVSDSTWCTAGDTVPVTAQALVAHNSAGLPQTSAAVAAGTLGAGAAWRQCLVNKHLSNKNTHP